MIIVLFQSKAAYALFQDASVMKYIPCTVISCLTLVLLITLSSLQISVNFRICIVVSARNKHF